MGLKSKEIKDMARAFREIRQFHARHHQVFKNLPYCRHCQTEVNSGMVKVDKDSKVVSP